MTWEKLALELYELTEELKADNDKAEARERALAKVVKIRNANKRRHVYLKLWTFKSRCRYNPPREAYDPYWLFKVETTRGVAK